MRRRKISRLVSRWVMALAIVAIAAPVAQARHAPAEAQFGISTTTPVDAITRHNHPDVIQPPTRIVAVAPAGGFDWGDAGIGAGAAVGAALFATGSALLIKRANRRAIPARFES